MVFHFWQTHQFKMIILLAVVNAVTIGITAFHFLPNLKKGDFVQKKRRRKKKMDFSKKTLICLAIFFLVFVVAQYVSFLVTGQEQSTLITLVIGGSCVEVFNLATIKKTKIKTDYGKEDVIDNRKEI